MLERSERREKQHLRDVFLFEMPDLMRQHRFQFRLIQLRHQRVEQHNFPELSEPGAYWTKLELFLMKIQSFRLSPHLSSRRGHPPVSIRPLFIVVLSGFRCLAACPTSVGFMARAALDV